jgi:Asp-tRNA(Asn)/Glu-tRNA(Gln) amidotransferase A subunit family amidase
VLLGKTGLHEFAYGTSSINPFYGAIGNPWTPDHDPGGSSGGSASAVAAGLAYTALGTDTGCSIRQPAHCCGITGFKPSFGAVSKAGVFPLARRRFMRRFPVMTRMTPTPPWRRHRVRRMPERVTWPENGWAWCAGFSSMDMTM